MEVWYDAREDRLYLVKPVLWGHVLLEHDDRYWLAEMNHMMGEHMCYVGEL